MDSILFEQGPIRPVDEADSLLIRTTRGCPWNGCTFCGLYENMRFSIRSVSEIKKDITAAKTYFSGHAFKSCFLQDGDSFVMDTDDLIEILTHLKKEFPSLMQISSYGRAQTMVKKSQTEIKEICDAGLNKLYCGMESGSAEVLRRVKKGITPESVIISSQMANEAGMHTTQFIILGLGGKALSSTHALETARVINTINPNDIRILTLTLKQGTPLYEQWQDKRFDLMSETRMVQEQRLLLENIDGVTSHYANHHSVDLLLEIRGQLPQDKDYLLEIVDRFLALDEKEQIHFILGRRLGYYSQLSHRNNKLQYDFVQKQVEKITTLHKGDFETIFHDLRCRVI